MTIELQTGLPGHCKTLYTLDRIETLRRKTGRPVFYNGIKLNAEKLPDWQPIEADQWYTAPPEAIVVIDECQRLFRPRAAGSAVPKYESELETHRHGGIDLVLLTQKPRLVSTAVRELVGRHLHVVRRFGLQRSTVHEWPELQFNVQNRKNSVKHEYKFNREVFSWYHSAEAHTVTRNVPMRVYALIGIVVLFPLLIWYIAHRVWGFAEHGVAQVPGASAAASAPVGAVQSAAVSSSTSSSQKLSATAYVAQFEPRVSGLAYTAPVYDEVTKPVVAPYPAACVSSASKGCQCFTQQATRLATPKALCEQIAAGGFFVAWAQPQVAPAERREERPVQAIAEVVGTPISLGGSHVRLGASTPSPSVLDDGPPLGGRGRNLSPALPGASAPSSR